MAANNGIEILTENVDGQLYAAVLKNHKIIDLYTDYTNTDVKWGSIYLARVKKIDAKQDFAILDLGGGKEGLIASKHLRLEKEQRADNRENISKRLKNGQSILVQVKSEGKRSSSEERNKLPNFTMKIYIPGRYLVYSPVSNAVTISRKIQNQSVFHAAAELEGDGGWIIRSSAENATAEIVTVEAKELKEQWQSIKDNVKNNASTPRLLLSGNNALNRAFIDYANDPNLERVEICGVKGFEQAKSWCEIHAQDWLDFLHIAPASEGSLFDFRDVSSELDMLDDSYVPLPSGGSIIIESVHAMTVIDVNRGCSPSIHVANTEAAIEVARQIKLRNISGAVIIDFISLRLKTDRFKLIEAFEKALSCDPAHPQIHGFTRLGMIEMTRKRRSAPLAEKTTL